MRNGYIRNETKRIGTGGDSGELDWDELISHICAATNWTWDYVLEHVDIPRIEALNRYWENHPPVQWMVASYLGIKPKGKSNQDGDIAQLMGMFGQSK